MKHCNIYLQIIHSMLEKNICQCDVGSMDKRCGWKAKKIVDVNLKIGTVRKEAVAQAHIEKEYHKIWK